MPAAPSARNSPPLRVRRAIVADRNALASLFLTARRSAFHWCDPDGFHFSDFADQTRGELILLAETAPGGALAGFVSVWRPDSFIHHLFVHPRHQRRGVGTLLLRHLALLLPFPWELKCLLQNTNALAFYHHLGWRETGSRGCDALGNYAVLRREIS